MVTLDVLAFIQLLISRNDCCTYIHFTSMRKKQYNESSTTLANWWLHCIRVDCRRAIEFTFIKRRLHFDDSPAFVRLENEFLAVWRAEHSCVYCMHVVVEKLSFAIPQSWLSSVHVQESCMKELQSWSISDEHIYFLALEPWITWFVVLSADILHENQIKFRWNLSQSFNVSFCLELLS